MHFEKAHSFIDDAVKNEKCVLVHCQAGVSRSASIVISYIMKRNKISFEEARNIVRQARPLIRPNFMFTEQLIAYEKMNFSVDSDHYLYYQMKAKMNTLVQAEKWDIAILSNKAMTNEEITKQLSDGIFQKTIQTYHCKKCSKILFSEQNVIGRYTTLEREREGEPDSHELYFYIEPMNWMNDLTKTSDILKCSCDEIIGDWQWKRERYFNPRFRVAIDKVDIKPVFNFNINIINCK